MSGPLVDCPRCRRTIRLNAKGRLYRHVDIVGDPCPASLMSYLASLTSSKKGRSK